MNFVSSAQSVHYRCFFTLSTIVGHNQFIKYYPCIKITIHVHSLDMIYKHKSWVTLMGDFGGFYIKHASL